MLANVFNKNNTATHIAYNMGTSYREVIENLAKEQVQKAMAVPKNPFTPSPDGSFVHFCIDNQQLTVTQHATICTVREPPVIDFLKDVCRSFPKPIQGTYVFGLEDAYQPGTYDHVLVFSKRKGADTQVLMPDLYAMANYNGKLQVPDHVPFFSKNDGAFFVGCTTGNTDPIQNRRLQLCDWSHTHGSHHGIKAYVSHIVQMNTEDVYRAYPSAPSYVKNDMIDIPEQLKFKYNINMDGNTCAWDRLAWILASQSVCLKERTSNVNWYYPLLEDGTHYIGFDNFDEIPELLSSSSSHNPREIIQNANEFVRTYLSYEGNRLYAGYVLYYLGLLQQPAS